MMAALKHLMRGLLLLLAVVGPAMWSWRRRERQVASRHQHMTVSLVGYTNAGKSTLLNALTGADAQARWVAVKSLVTLYTSWRSANGALRSDGIYQLVARLDFNATQFKRRFLLECATRIQSKFIHPALRPGMRYKQNAQRLVLHERRIYFLKISIVGTGKMKPVPFFSASFSRSTNSSLKCQGNTR
jgi:septin family protein